MVKYHITEKDEYDYCVQHGIEPLIDDNFTIDIKLRVERNNRNSERERTSRR